MEKLEKYILEHKSSLDVYSPSAKCNDRFKSYLFDEVEKVIISNKSKLDSDQPSDNVWENIKNELEGDESFDINLDQPTGSIDKFEAPTGLWDKISTELDQDDQKLESKDETPKVKEVHFSKNYRWWSSIAAAIVIGIGIGFIFKTQQLPLKENNATVKADTEWNQAEQYFKQVINTKQIQIKKLNYQDVRLLSDFDSQLGTLKDNYKDLKRELKTSEQPEIIKKQMIIVLELQVELLNKQMEIILDQTKEDHKDEKVQQYNI
ncbi:hypothetical protein MY04_1586 [Flammeovirga sp. MY04]|uniref:hypothetical protein n=1 Tax=Flammeovirga sp. MY04 TaxID=1191459 RepID=UPI00080608DD|nr:hypothetical protein [Flammeovirga sp. MY04]ANQ48960.1 hypothetical protein MY04_1586 [Flammeovirga sp. MY04]